LEARADDDKLAALGVDRELHVGAAGVHADLAQTGDRGVAQDLVFLVGQGQRRRHGDRIAGVDAHGVQVLDRADDDAVVRPVAHHLHLEFLPALLDHGHVFVAVVGDAAARAAEREGGPDDRRQANHLERGPRFVFRGDHGALRHPEADVLHGLAEQLAVFGAGDGEPVGADQLDIVLEQRLVVGQRHGDVEGGLPAHGRQQGIGPLLIDDTGHHLGGDGLDVGRVRQARVGHDRGGVGVDQDDPVAFFPERLAGLSPRVVELAGLADHDRPGADDQDRFDVVTSGHSN
jgi:hypothetical protein